MVDHKELLRTAYRFAAQKSTDLSTQNGAILVNDEGMVMATGANHLPEGVVWSADRIERPMKYNFFEHAERNVIYDAARRGIKTEGLVMFGCWVACTDCARAIIQAGIRDVVTHHDPTSPTRFGMPAAQSWLDSIKVAMKMFDEAGVRLKVLDDQLFDPAGDFVIRFNGQKVTP